MKRPILILSFALLISLIATSAKKFNHKIYRSIASSSEDQISETQSYILMLQQQNQQMKAKIAEQQVANLLQLVQLYGNNQAIISNLGQPTLQSTFPSASVMEQINSYTNNIFPTTNTPQLTYSSEKEFNFEQASTYPSENISDHIDVDPTFRRYKQFPGFNFSNSFDAENESTDMKNYSADVLMI